VAELLLRILVARVEQHLRLEWIEIE